MVNIFESEETRPSLTSEAHRTNVENPVKPVMLDEVFYEDHNLIIKKICFWEKCSLWPDEETRYFKVLLPGGLASNFHCIGTYALPDGRRATDAVFHYLSDFRYGVAKTVIPGQGYSYINTNFEQISDSYNEASDFYNGYAIIKLLDKKN
ncbi:MAG: WG repeat-containing protein, partial [Treponema sp.]|nr:WG repeat-containing protein [Treponema sp.]